MTFPRLSRLAAALLLLWGLAASPAGGGEPPEVILDTHAHLMRNAQEGNPALLGRQIVQRMDGMHHPAATALPARP